MKFKRDLRYHSKIMQQIINRLKQSKVTYKNSSKKQTKILRNSSWKRNCKLRRQK